MQKRITVLLAACLALGVTSTAAFADRCSGHGHDTGSILGAVGGGLIGNAITHGSGIGIVGGAVAGGLAGNAIARDIDCNRGRHYSRRAHGYYYYDRHGHRVYEDRQGRLYHRDRDHYVEADR